MPRSASVCTTKPCAWRLRASRCGSAGAPSRSLPRRRRARVRLEHLQRLVPVARAHAADRRQAPRRVRRHRRVRVGQRVHGVRDAAGEAAVAGRERARAREHDDREQAQQQRAGAPAARCSDGALRPVQKPNASPASVSSTSIATTSAPSWCPASMRVGERDAVGAQRVRGEVPGRRPRRRQHRAVISTAAPRRRSGTMQNHSARPSTSATSAPRE